MFEEKYELLFQKATEFIRPYPKDNLDKIAILIQMSTNLKEQSEQEKTAYWKVYFKYDSHIKNQMEKEKWEKDFDEIYRKYKKNFELRKYDYEYEEYDREFREFYMKTREEFYSTPY